MTMARKKNSFPGEMYELRRTDTTGKLDFRIKCKKLDDLIKIVKRKFD